MPDYNRLPDYDGLQWTMMDNNVLPDYDRLHQTMMDKMDYDVGD